MSRPLYERAKNALEAAYQACYKHPDRDILGMSHGPFSGVNEALGIVTTLEEDNKKLKQRISQLEQQLAEKDRQAGG